MVIKPATQIGDPVIRGKSKPVANPVSPAAKAIARNLIDSMRYHGLVGMAGPQIGVGQRIFVTEIRETSARSPRGADSARVFINPKILKRSLKKVPGYEGCGSVAHGGLFGSVPRAQEVLVEAFDVKGRKFRLRATGLLARIIQHEQDHLDGAVFLDRMPDMKTLVSREELFLRQLRRRKKGKV